jgi:hypothetical protein
MHIFTIQRSFAAGAWVANCVGALNFRYFLGFVLANIIMLWYGALLAVATMWGVLKDAGMLDRPVNAGTGASLCSLSAKHFVCASPSMLIDWFRKNTSVSCGFSMCAAVFRSSIQCCSHHLREPPGYLSEQGW